MNTATNYAFAAGRRAKANHTGAFVWADSQTADFASLRNDQFRVRAEGGARFDFNAGEWVDLRLTSARIITTSSGAYLSQGGAWVNASDQARKNHFTPVDPQAVLAKVDADGVALAAIQGLNQKLDEQRAENTDLKRRVAELERLVLKLTRKENDP